ncbi:GTPase ObgE [Bernardetia sp. ABR2-2B]|uniref:GTPase ObgE n=1 Tax=Bernardetia sp. ABR2-2B TaxID=3127472 RepID=UPI0030D1B4EE
MDSPNFIDYVKLFLRSGKGGAGSRHFRKEKHVPLGGPDGGDGGRGGHVIIRANSQLWTLIHLRYQKHVFAEDGGNGSGQKSSGKQGEDTILEVPLGTVVKNSETGEKVAEVLEDGQEAILLHGGRGGLGNFHFRTSVNQAPEYAQPGEPCVEDWFTLELKVLADVGLVGFPNAGKSTLLSVVSAAKPKIANYAFTTLVPNLGVVPYRDHRSFVMADIPGIIEGAADGKGLGVRFLRHIERNSMLLFVISADTKNIRAEYDILVDELEKYNPELLDKKRLLAISKMDLIDDELKMMLADDLPKEIEHIFISAVAQMNLDTLKDKIWENLQK